jgi:putative transposase
MLMARHSHVKVWVHAIWGTYRHERIIHKGLRVQLFDHIVGEAKEMGLHIEKMNIQPEHVHVLFSLPADKTIAGIIKSIKGESSRWINESKLINNTFSWQRGYGAFSVSASQLETVKNYIKNQDAHHQKKTFTQEYEEWARKYGVWDD